MGGVTTSAACGGGSDERTLPPPVDVPETVAIGVLPDPQTDAATLPTPPPPPTTEPVPSSTTPAEVEPIDTPIGGDVSGGGRRCKSFQSDSSGS